MNSGNTIQIEAPDFDPDINGISSPSTEEIPNKLLTQGTASPTPKTTEPEIECSTPATSTQQTASQDTARVSGNRQTPVILTELKFLIWKRIPKKNSMLI